MDITSLFDGGMASIGGAAIAALLLPWLTSRIKDRFPDATSGWGKEIAAGLALVAYAIGWAIEGADPATWREFLGYAVVAAFGGSTGHRVTEAARRPKP